MKLGDFEPQSPQSLPGGVTVNISGQFDQVCELNSPVTIVDADKTVMSTGQQSQKSQTTKESTVVASFAGASHL